MRNIKKYKVPRLGLSAIHRDREDRGLLEQSDIQTEPKILSGYWSDKEGIKIKSAYLKQNVQFHVITEHIEDGEEITLNLHDWDGWINPDDQLGFKKKAKVSDNKCHIEVNLSSSWQKYIDDDYGQKIELYFSVEYNKIEVDLPVLSADYLYVEKALPVLLELNGLDVTDDTGWLNVKKEDGVVIQIARYTRVEYLGYDTDKKREKFKILDWPNRNVFASVSAISSSKSRFKNFKYQEMGLLTYDRDNDRIKYEGSSWIHAKSVSFDTDFGPIAKGVHNVWLPDYMHNLGSGYLHLTKNTLTWYRLGPESSSRYLHVGGVSDGCITVGHRASGGTDRDRKRWDDIYDYLKLRRGDNKYVAKVKVI